VATEIETKVREAVGVATPGVAATAA
jgi:hypothetical protein